MVSEREERRLAAIFSADMVGYSRLMEADERGTIARQKAHRNELIDPKISEHNGRIVKTTGDGLLVEFASVVDATACAVAIQRALEEREADVPNDRRIQYRVGVNLGDIVIEGGDIFGDGVNVASRLEGLAEPGGVCISGTAYDHLKKKVNAGYEDLGEVRVKNIKTPVRVYRVLLDLKLSGTLIRAKSGSTTSRQLIAAALAVVVVVVGGVFWWSSKVADVEPIKTTRLESPKPAKASLAVLPLRNISGNADQDVFVAGLSQDLNSALSRVPELLVISQNSTGKYKGKAVEIKQVAKELAVGHVVTGTVQRSENRLRVTAQLIDGSSGASVWSNRYDRSIADLFALQDDIVKNVLVELQVTLTTGDTARILSRGTNSLDAWLLNVRAESEALKFNREANARARELYQAAAEADANWALPYGGLAWTYREAIRRGWSKTVEEDRKRGIELAQKVIQMDPSSAIGYIQLGNLYIEGGRLDEGIALREKALDLAPSNFWAAVGLAWQLIFVGQEKRALELYQLSKKISPLHPAWLLSSEAFAFHVDGQLEKAASTYKQAISRGKFPIFHGRLAAVYADLGQTEEAREQVKLLLDQKPTANISDLTRILRFQDPKRTDWYVGLLRKAGIPE